MKILAMISKKYLFIFTMIWFHLTSYAQIVEYVEFPNDTAKWTQTITLQGFEPGMPYTESGMDYYLLGDTTLNGNLYQKVYAKESFSVVGDSSSYLNRPLDFIGGIREDTTKKIYFRYLSDIKPRMDNAFYKFTNGEEYLLYDFDIEVGDTLEWMVPESFILDSDANVLKRIDTIELYEDHFRRKFIFSDSLWYTSDIYWISGIGSSQGLFGPYRENAGDANEPRLVCFNDKTNAILLEGETRFEEAKNCNFLYDQYLPEEMNEEEEEEEESEEAIDSLCDLEVYPNPFNKELKIRIPKNEEVTIEIYDASARIIYSEKFEEDLITLKLPNLAAGVYFLKVSNDEKEEIRKIVKMY